MTDGRCDKDKLGAACDQAAWYALLCQRALIEDGLPADAVSTEGFIVVAKGVGLTPILLRQNLMARIGRAERLLASTPDPAQILSSLPYDVQFPAVDVEPEERIELLEDLLDDIGSNYRPGCLHDCGMARLCRSRAHDQGLPALCGSAVVRQLPGVPSLARAVELSERAPPRPEEAHVASALERAASVYDRVLKQGAL